MILAPGTFARVGAAALLAVLLQVSAVSHVHLLGASADLLPLLVGAAGLYGGSIAGAATGFGTGLLLDLALGVNVGASSLVLTTIGYGAGRYRERRDPAHGLAPIPVGAAVTAGYLVGVAGINFMLEIPAPATPACARASPGRSAGGACATSRGPPASPGGPPACTSTSAARP